jgi:FtsP/CotA-like multicopper oxidase with cupredoxin domain
MDRFPVLPSSPTGKAFLVGSVKLVLILFNRGDEVVVHLTNSLAPDSGNGTSLHFHGVRQNYTNQMDGVTSVTQCPTAPGESYEYRSVHSSQATQLYFAELLD